MNSDQASSSNEDALQNSLVLRKIFSYLPTNSLLSSCSLVNKLWNTEARKLIRDSRKCTARDPDGWNDEPCIFFKKLGQLCEQVVKQGRVVHWNSVSILIRGFCYPQCTGQPVEQAACSGVMMTQMQIKHLELLFYSDEFECLAHRPLSTLLHWESANVLSLHINGLPKFTVQDLSHLSHVHFPKLLDFQVTSLHRCYEPGQQSERAFVSKLLQGAPNLKRIVTDGDTLAVIPEEKYGLLTWLRFPARGTAEMERVFGQIALSQPALEQLEISAGWAFDHDDDNDRDEFDGNIDEIHVHNQPLKRFDRTLEMLLHGCEKSLKKIEISGAYPLARLSFPPLVNLSTLRIFKPFGASIKGLWRAIASIDYAVSMPGLLEVTISLDTAQAYDDVCNEDEVAYMEWPDTDQHHLHQHSTSSSSVRNLSLCLQVRKVNMSALKTAFPNLTVLNFRVQNWKYGLGNTELPCFSQISELWPDLEELQVHGWKKTLEKNWDADFCGIDEEEVEILREKDEEYLKAVHIVPTRPCPLTMAGLRKLRIDLWFDCKCKKPSHGFISEVAQLVVLKRMQQGRDISVSWDYDDNSEDDDSSEDDE